MQIPQPIKNIVGCAVFIFIASVLIKFVSCTLHIWYGKHLRKKLCTFSSDKSKTNQIYSQIKQYCKAVKLNALSNPYGISDRFINKSNSQVQKLLTNSLDEAIGIYIYRRLHCYILLPIQPNDKSASVCKIILDALIKLAASVACSLIKDMLL